MPFVTEFDVKKQEPAPKPAEKPKEIAQPDVGAGKEKPTKISGPKDQLSLRFKKYLNENGLYRGNIEDPSYDPEFIAGLKKLEEIISSGLERTAKAPPNSAAGLIWQGNQINQETSPEDIEAALKLIAQAANMKKDAQVNLDSIDLTEEMPTAVKFNKNQEESKLETGDPLDSQQIGRSQEELPMPDKLNQIKERIEKLKNLAVLL